MKNNALVRKKLEEILKEIFSDFKADEDYNRKFSLFEEWDSLNHMRLIGTIEERFDISVGIEEVEDLENAKLLLNLIEIKIGEKNE